MCQHQVDSGPFMACYGLHIEGLVQEKHNSIANVLEIHNGSVQERHNSIANALDLPLYGLVQERRNSIANTLELHLSCTTPYDCPPVCLWPVPVISGYDWRWLWWHGYQLEVCGVIWGTWLLPHKGKAFQKKKKQAKKILTTA